MIYTVSSIQVSFLDCRLHCFELGADFYTFDKRSKTLPTSRERVSRLLFPNASPCIAIIPETLQADLDSSLLLSQTLALAVEVLLLLGVRLGLRILVLQRLDLIAEE